MPDDYNDHIENILVDAYNPDYSDSLQNIIVASMMYNGSGSQEDKNYWEGSIRFWVLALQQDIEDIKDSLRNS